MAMNRTRRTLGWVVLLGNAVLGLAIWFGAIVLSTRPQLKVLVDASPQAQFTISEATLDLISQVRERGDVLELDMFWQPVGTPRTAEELHYVGIYGRVHGLTRDLLEQLSYHGGDSVVFRQHNLNDIKTRAEVNKRSKLLGVQADSVVTLKMGDVTRKLHMFRDMAQIERPRRPQLPGQRQQVAPPTLKSYDGEEALTSSLLGMLKYGNPKVYFVLGLGLSQEQLTGSGSFSYSALLRSLDEDGFEIEYLTLDTNADVPGDAEAVVLLEPDKELSELATEVLWRYLRRGGRVFVDFVLERELPDWNPNFEGFLEKLGLVIGEGQVCTAIVRGNTMYGGEQAARFPVVVDESHPITKPLAEARNPVIFSHARPLFLREGRAEVTTKRLLQTLNVSWNAERIGAGGSQFNYTVPRDMSQLAPQSVGAVATVVPDESALPAGSEPRQGLAVVMSGLAFINFALGREDNYNRDLALNTLNWLTERKERVTVRANRYVSRTLSVQDQDLIAVRQLLVYWIPGVLLALGSAVFVWRNRG